MRVTRSRIDVIPLVAPDRRGLVLSFIDDEGRTGLGEATPLPGYSPDSADSCHSALFDAAATIDTFEPSAEGVGAAVAPLAGVLRGLPAARFALETALLDLAGQKLGVPISEVLGGPRPYTEVAVNGLLSASVEIPALLKSAAAFVARGIRCIKVKLKSKDQAGFDRELQALIALRRELGDDIELRLDANGAWTEDEARRRLEALAPLAPRFVEQPVAADRLHQLGRCAAPWAADESLVLPGMALRLLEAEGCAAFVIKPAALGLLRAHAITVLAEARGVDVVVTHLFDGPIALAAACELALSLQRPPLASGLDEHLGLSGWPRATVPQRRGPVVAAGGHAGLGVAPWKA